MNKRALFSKVSFLKHWPRRGSTQEVLKAQAWWRPGIRSI